MGRIDTGAIAAKMIWLKATKDRPQQALKGPSMSANCLASPKLPVALAGTACCPLPARVEIGPVGWNGAELHLSPKSDRQTRITKEGRSGKLWLHRNRPFGVVQPEVSCLAAAFIIPLLGITKLRHFARK